MTIEGFATAIEGKLNARPRKADLPLNVRDFGAVGDGAADDTAAIQAALAAAGVGARLHFPRGVYTLSAPIDMSGLVDVTLTGEGPHQSVFQSGVAELTSAFTSSGDVSGVTFRGLGWMGSAVDDVNGPRRSRTFGTGSIRRAIWLEGDLETGTRIIRDITVTGCYAYGTANLPVFLTGIRGEARIENSCFDNCFDIGFTNCEAAVFLNNRVTRSCDNGVSLSRGNQRVVCVGNNFEDCAYWAIWLAGFAGEKGAQNFTVSGNMGSRLGHGGVTCDLGARDGTITGNHFSEISRGPADEPSDNYGVGVFIAGFPADPAAVTDPAENITVTGNTVVDAARGGVLVRGARNVNVTGNTITRPGSLHRADGTTVITTAMVRENFGVAIDDAYVSTVTNSAFTGNLVVDDRPTPVLNVGVHIGVNASTAVLGNVVAGNRLQQAESGEVLRGGLKTFVPGIRLGSSGIPGVTLRISAAAGSSRAIQLETDSSARWQIRADGASESGGNSGSNLIIEPRSDSGASLGAILTLIRATGGLRHEDKPLGFYGATPTAKPSVTGSRGGNAALASLITALALLGLVTDNSTA